MQFGKVTSRESFSREKRIFQKLLCKLILNTLGFVSAGIVSDVEIDVGLGNGKVRIRVKDDGIGMDDFFTDRFLEFSKAPAKAASFGLNFRKVLKSNEPH
jgi:hypothetical protein